MKGFMSFRLRFNDPHCIFYFPLAKKQEKNTQKKQKTNFNSTYNTT